MTPKQQIQQLNRDTQYIRQEREELVSELNELEGMNVYHTTDTTGLQYPLYKQVTVEPSNSSYGRWVVKISDVTFRFFWKKAQANAFATKFNQDMNGAQVAVKTIRE